MRSASACSKPLARYRPASSACSSSGIASSSARSSSIWRSNSSRWLCIEMYSPAAIENAPGQQARRCPASRMKCASPAVAAPATPMTSERFETSPSLDAEDHRPQRPGAGAAVPALALGDLVRRCRAAVARLRVPGGVEGDGGRRGAAPPCGLRRRRCAAYAPGCHWPGLDSPPRARRAPAASRSRRARARRRRSPRPRPSRPGRRTRPPRRPRAPGRAPRRPSSRTAARAR